MCVYFYLKLYVSPAMFSVYFLLRWEQRVRLVLCALIPFMKMFYKSLVPLYFQAPLCRRQTLHGPWEIILWCNSFSVKNRAPPHPHAFLLNAIACQHHNLKKTLTTQQEYYLDKLSSELLFVDCWIWAGDVFFWLCLGRSRLSCKLAPFGEWTLSFLVFAGVVGYCSTAGEAYATGCSSEKPKTEANLSAPDLPVSAAASLSPSCDDFQIVTCLLQAVLEPVLGHVISD